MKSLMTWISTVAVVGLLAGTAVAADTITAGKVKSVNAEQKEFVLTDGNDKDWTIKFGKDAVINRGGKESFSDLKAGETISVCYDKGLLTSTAHYILVREGDSKFYHLRLGTFKGYDADKKEFTYTDAGGKDWSYAMGDAKVRLNMQDGKIEDMKVGEHSLAVVEEMGDKVTLKSLMVKRDS